MGDQPDMDRTRAVLALMARIREQANLLIEDGLRKRGIKGVVPAHGRVLAVLFQAGAPLPMKEIARRAGRVKSTITGMVDTLVRRGFAAKQPSDEDGRVVLVELTPKGWELLPDFNQISEDVLSALYGGMDQKDREILAGLLGRLDDNLARSLARGGAA